MGFLHTLLNQPSRSYSLPEPANAAALAKRPEEQEQEQEQDERAARKSQYYSAAADPNLRREWERILHNDRAKARPGPSLRASARSIPISPRRPHAFVVLISSYRLFRTAYACLIPGPAFPRSRN